VTNAAGAALAASVSATPTAVGAEVRVQLSAAATVEARVINLAGRPVKRLATAAALPQGTSTLVWTGQADSGLAAPPGAYLVVIDARAEDGHQVRAVGRLTLRR
jgi:hypothetical protein